jgi:hypothetical protein
METIDILCSDLSEAKTELDGINSRYGSVHTVLITIKNGNVYLRGEIPKTQN